MAGWANVLHNFIHLHPHILDGVHVRYSQCPVNESDTSWQRRCS